VGAPPSSPKPGHPFSRTKHYFSKSAYGRKYGRRLKTTVKFYRREGQLIFFFYLAYLAKAFSGLELAHQDASPYATPCGISLG
jgi:hypothetical protein